MPTYSDEHDEYYQWRGLTLGQRLDEMMQHLEGAAHDGYLSDTEAQAQSQRAKKIILYDRWAD